MDKDDPDYWYDLSRRCGKQDITALVEMMRIVPPGALIDLFEMSAQATQEGRTLNTAEKKKMLVWGFRMAMGREPTEEEVKELITTALLPPHNEKVDLSILQAFKAMLNDDS